MKLLTSHNSTTPAPSHYHPNDSFTLEKVAYSISFGVKNELHKTTNMLSPGPGNYAINNSRGCKNVKFGTGKRESLECKSTKYVPGPGAYKITENKNSSSHKFIFSKGKREGILNKSFAPGPGNYVIKGIFGNEGTKPTMQGRPTSAPKEGRMPGPGAYNPNKKTNAPSYKISMQTRKDVLNSNMHVPGPGQYKSDSFTFASNMTKAPKWKIGKDKRDNIKLNLSVPGPGTYGVKTTIGEGPKTQLSMKLPGIKSKVNVPGPGAYNSNPNVLFKSSQKAGIGKGERNGREFKKNSVPGPDAYQKQSMIIDGPKYGYIIN